MSKCEDKIKNCGIYKITSPTGKIYIGQSIDLKKRLNTYRSMYKSTKRQVKLYRSIEKYGWLNHQFDIIEYCSIEDLNCSERFWQDIFDVIGENGLNCILQNCGDARRICSQETKDKISKANSGENHPMFGKKQTEEAIKLRTDKIRGENHYLFGKNQQQETRDKISSTLKSRCVNVGGKNGNAKLILCLETGIYYDSVRDASRAYNFKMRAIERMLNKNCPVINKTSLVYVDDYVEISSIK
jgi:group I intron endonuclease